MGQQAWLSFGQPVPPLAGLLVCPEPLVLPSCPAHQVGVGAPQQAVQRGPVEPAGWVGLGRPAGVAPGGFPRPARRTRRACLHATGAPRVLPAGHQPGAGAGVQGVGMVLPR